MSTGNGVMDENCHDRHAITRSLKLGRFFSVVACEQQTCFRSFLRKITDKITLFFGGTTGNTSAVCRLQLKRTASRDRVTAVTIFIHGTAFPIAIIYIAREKSLLRSHVLGRRNDRKYFCCSQAISVEAIK